MKYAWLSLGLLVCCAALSTGCARAARDTTGFAMEDSAIIEAPFEDAWQMTKAVLRENALEIYTRDKRGTFVAYTPMKRGVLNPKPTRTEFTFVLEDLNNNTTQLYATTLDQVYGVTLLTYPGWHDRRTTDNSDTLAIIEAVQAKASGGFQQPVIEESADMPETIMDETPADELGGPQTKRKWYRKLNPATWFGGKEKDAEPSIDDQQAPTMAPAGAPADDVPTPGGDAIGEPRQASPTDTVEPTPAPATEEGVMEEATDADGEPMPTDEAPKRRWFHRLNPKSWF